MKIVPLEKSQIAREELIELWRQCGLLRPWNDPNADIERKLAFGDGGLIVGLSCEGDLLASAMYGYEGHRGWINYFAVAPTSRMRGLGRLLAQHIIEKFEVLGCAKVNVQVRAENGEGLEFWRSLGFRVDEALSLGLRLIHDSSTSVTDAGPIAEVSAT